jgi:hypothetical protein
MSSPTVKELEVRAYQLWEADGRRTGAQNTTGISHAHRPTGY